MTKQELLDLINDPNLQNPGLQGAADAILDILNALTSPPSGPSAPPIGELPPIKLDPEKPHIKGSGGAGESPEYDDPDNIRHKMDQIDLGLDDDPENPEDEGDTWGETGENSEDSKSKDGERKKSDKENGSSDKKDSSDDEGSDSSDGNADADEIADRRRILNRAKNLLKMAAKKARQDQPDNTDLQEKIKKAQESLDNISEEVIESDDSTEFDNAIADARDAMSDVTPSYTSKDMQGRIKKIRDLEADKDASRELEREDKDILDQDYDSKARKLQRELDKYKDQRASLEDLKIDLDALARLQVKTEKRHPKTWRAFSARLESEGIIKKNPTVKTIRDQNKPLFQLYVDQSTSWGPADVKRAKEVLAILDLYKDKDLLDAEIWYFGDDISNISPAGVGGSTGAWPKIYNNIKKTQPTNVIIMTDHDLYNQGDPASKTPTPLEIQGGVLWIWGSSDSSKLMKYLVGRTMNKEYQI